MVLRDQRQRRANYQGLTDFADLAERQTIKTLIDRIGALEHTNEQQASQIAVLTARPALSLAEVKQIVQQQVAAGIAQREATIPPAGIPGDTNTIPSDALPLYDGSGIVAAVFAANPAFVATSCQSAPGGNWDLMDAIVDALRAVDTRFAYNGKRGNASDPSNDAISYDFGAVPGGEGSTDVYIIDVISGHCGPTPSPGWNDVTVFAPGVWISRGRF